MDILLFIYYQYIRAKRGEGQKPQGPSFFWLWQQQELRDPMLLVFDIVKKSKVNRSFQDVQQPHDLNILRPISSAGGENVGKTS